MNVTVLLKIKPLIEKKKASIYWPFLGIT